MWTREQIKTNAKAVLSKNYWLMLGVSTVYVILSGIFSSVSSSVSQFSSTESQALWEYYQISPEILLGLASISLILSIGSVLFAVFVASPLEVGKNRFFMRIRLMPTKFSELFFPFSKAKNFYLNIVKTQFLRSLFTVLWTLLLIVPGIVKSYEYRMIPYILAENPSISSKRAFELSKKMTDGEKMNIFVLDLSFIGWSLLGLLACCIGAYFVQPYFEATYAELYEAMRAKAFDTGITDETELCNFWN